jgi:hypothetical protein
MLHNIHYARLAISNARLIATALDIEDGTQTVESECSNNIEIQQRKASYKGK